MCLKGKRPWTDKIDPATIPDAVIASEHGKRNARKRKSYTGGAVWAKHNPEVANCRCARCNARRAKDKKRRRPTMKQRQKKILTPPKPARKQSTGEEPRERRVPLGLEELFAAHPKEPHACYFRVNKEMIDDWLANHLNLERQRPLLESTVDTLERLHDEGFWNHYKMHVVFDSNREIRNGMHSSTMLSKLDKKEVDYWINLAINLPPDICDDWDQIRKRTINDEMKIKGFRPENREMLGRVSKIYWQYSRNHYDNLGYQFDRAPGKIAQPVEGIQIAIDNPDLAECIFPFPEELHGKGFSAAAVYAMYCPIRRMFPKEAPKFFSTLADGLGLAKGDDPIYVLRKCFLNSSQKKNRLRNGWTAAYVIKAFNLWMAGLPARGPLMRENEPFPKIGALMEIPDDGRKPNRTH